MITLDEKTRVKDYIHFKSALIAQCKKRLIRRNLKQTLFPFANHVGVSDPLWDVFYKIDESYADGTFREKFLNHKEKYLDRNILKKFYKNS